MTKFTENIIKLTDYPFTYSFIGLVIFIGTGNKFDITQIDVQNYLPFLVLIGVFGTILSIIDPVGNSIRFYLYRYKKEGIKIFSSNVNDWLSRHLKLRPSTVSPTETNSVDAKKSKTPFKLPKLKYKKPRTWGDFEDYLVRKNDFQYYKEVREYETKINSTNWISYEIDKIVSVIYFSTIVLLTIIVFQDENLYSSFINLINNSQTTTGSNGISIFYMEYRIAILVFLIISTILLGIAITTKLKRLKDRVEVIKVYFKVNDDLDQYKKNTEQYDILLENIKNLLFYINKRDWGMAEYFAKNITKRTDKLDVDNKKED